MTKAYYDLEHNNIDIFLEGDVLASAKTSYQDVLIINTERFGKVLLLDSVVQLSERDEAFYHEALVHPALCTHSKPENILIIGGGDGGTLREALKHPVKTVTLIDIDKEAMDLIRTHLPIAELAFADKRATIINDDGKAYLEQTRDVFDVIIVDISDPLGPSAQLFTKEFYELAKQKLHANGILVVQANSPVSEPRAFGRINATLSTIFKNTLAYCNYIPSFFVSEGYVIASDAALDTANIIAALKQRNIPLFAYTPEQLARLLESCPYCTPVLAQDWPISTADNPVEVD